MTITFEYGKFRYGPSDIGHYSLGTVESAKLVCEEPDILNMDNEVVFYLADNLRIRITRELYDSLVSRVQLAKEA